MPYGAAHEELKRAGRRDGHGFSTRQFIAYKQNRIANYAVIDMTDDLCMNSTLPTLVQALRMFRSGRYLFRTTRHIFAVIDGVIHDTYPDGARRRVSAVWKLEAL
jgi:hypothetical protein